MQRRIIRLLAPLSLSIILATPLLASAAMWTAADYAGGHVRGFNQRRGFKAAAAYGANVMRFSIDSSTGGLSNNGSQFRIGGGAFGTFDLTALDTVVANAQAAGIKIIFVIDDHAMMTNGSLQNSFIAMWQAIAAHYKTGTTYADTVAGYDLWNEPHGGGASQAGWISLSQTTTSAIRAIDPDHVIIWEPFEWGLAWGFDGMTTMPLAAYGNIVYSYHAYDPHQFTGQGVEYAYGQKYPNNSLACFPGGTNLNWNASTLGPQGFNCDGSGRQTLLDLQAQYHFPIFVGEFSAYTASPFKKGKPSATQWVDDIIAYFESKGFSWAYHSWREWWGWDAEVDQAEAVRLRNGGSYPINRNSNSPTIQVFKNYFKMNAGGPNVPVNTAVPTISGTAQVGQTLTACCNRRGHGPNDCDPGYS
jgi:cellulase (glycosyl hydrolase family 5)